MKKFIVAISAILYLSTSMGATIHLHYCMGKLVNWGMSHKSPSICSNCGMQKSHKEMNEGCCKDDYKQIKNEKDQKLSESFTQLNKVIIELAPIGILTYSISLPSISYKVFPNLNALLRSYNTSLTIINCVFRI